MDGQLNERIGRLAKISETTGKGVEGINITEPFVSVMSVTMASAP